MDRAGLPHVLAELHERGFDFFCFEAAACDSRLVGHDEHQMVVQGAKLVGNVGQQFDYDVAVGVERNLALLVELDQRPAEIKEQRRVAIRIGHLRKRFRLRVAPVNVIANMREHFVQNFDARFGLRACRHYSTRFLAVQAERFRDRAVRERR